MKTLSCASIFLLVLVDPWSADCATADPRTRVNLLLTHPSVLELKNIANLKQRGLLRVPNLHLVGIYHQSEWTDYTKAHDYIRKEAHDWMELRKISCPLSPATIYGKNDCTSAFHKLFQGSSGILFSGGPDIPPVLYGEKTRLTTVIHDPPRHLFELSFLFHLLGSSRDENWIPFLSESPNYAVLGICLGMQSINVATGGTLIQDISTQVYRVQTYEDGQKLPAEKIHRSYTAPLYPSLDLGRIAIHPIRFVDTSPIKKALLPQGKTPNVASIHHQAVKSLGKDLKVLATSLDGKIVEALRHKKYPGVLGVQFHPEKLLLWDAQAVYLKRQGASTSNYVAHWYANDKKAQAFHQAYWRLVGNLLTTARGRGFRY